jgi:hypothetical protein
VFEQLSSCELHEGASRHRLVIIIITASLTVAEAVAAVQQAHVRPRRGVQTAPSMISTTTTLTLTLTLVQAATTLARAKQRGKQRREFTFGKLKHGLKQREDADELDEEETDAENT